MGHFTWNQTWSCKAVDKTKRTKEVCSSPECKISQSLTMGIWICVTSVMRFPEYCLRQKQSFRSFTYLVLLLHQPLGVLITLIRQMITETISHNWINVITEILPAANTKGLNSQSSIWDINNHNQQTSISKLKDYISETYWVFWLIFTQNEISRARNYLIRSKKGSPQVFGRKHCGIFESTINTI